MWWMGFLGCSADPLVAMADPLVAVRPGGFAVVALTPGEDTSTLSVSKLPTGTRCGFLLGEVLSAAVPLGDGRADAAGVVSMTWAVPHGAAREVVVQAVCALGSELYSAPPTRVAVPPRGVGPA